MIKTTARGFNTQPPEGGWFGQFGFDDLPIKFQHTAARRRLALLSSLPFLTLQVSTHSRPKAAGIEANQTRKALKCFNTQPPEGGWVLEP